MTSLDHVEVVIMGVWKIKLYKAVFPDWLEDSIHNFMFMNVSTCIEMELVIVGRDQPIMPA